LILAVLHESAERKGEKQREREDIIIIAIVTIITIIKMEKGIVLGQRKSWQLT
jgi:hypothetical protein